MSPRGFSHRSRPVRRVSSLADARRQQREYEAAFGQRVLAVAAVLALLGAVTLWLLSVRDSGSLERFAPDGVLPTCTPHAEGAVCRR